jgi:hypothetical protein
VARRKGISELSSDVHDMEVTPAMEKKMEKVIKPVNVKDQSRMI